MLKFLIYTRFQAFLDRFWIFASIDNQVKKWVPREREIRGNKGKGRMFAGSFFR